ncbi:PREDICTED: recQ-mediated genome instability protein 2 [Miniopterus natalensis]|uniref:recQ-mediated genome instability protein 2 n=1 Tax=Miniopterus natalensis TaxID=291302 RepID=UPI0007A6EAB7|nr:PREDICTED: recQ-mediated genome instability protein 2 [Miniopterus natalensis]
MRTSGGLRGPLNREVPPSDRPLAGSASSPLIGARGPGPSAYQSWREYRPPSVMAAAAVADSFSRGGSAAVRVPRSAPVKVLAEQLRRAFSVCGLDRVPRGRPCLAPGKYVMVMGVIQAHSPEPRLQAVKMTDLSDNPVHESMWALEVEDLHRNIP